MCSGSEAGPYSKRIDFVYHSTLGVRVERYVFLTLACPCRYAPQGKAGVKWGDSPLTTVHPKP